MKQFTVTIHRGEPGEGGFWATCLEVPGAKGQGETREECLENLREAVELTLLDDSMRFYLRHSGFEPR